jgi:hypothetical protein
MNQAAPTGWTRFTSYDDCLIRVAGSTTLGAGGTYGFVAVFNSQTVVGNTTLSTSTMPSHAHAQETDTHIGSAAGKSQGSYTGGNFNYGGTTQAQGGGGAHNHGFYTQIKYADVMIATKN